MIDTRYLYAYRIELLRCTRLVYELLCTRRTLDLVFVNGIIDVVVRFNIGDRYYLLDNRLLCEVDYKQRMLYGGSSLSATHLSAAAVAAPHPAASNVPDDASSGYGSPSPPTAC